MLTKNDLNQIREVVREEIKLEVEPLDNKLIAKIDSLDKKLDKVQGDMGEYLNHLEPRVTAVEKRLDNIEEDLNFPKAQ